MDEMVIDILEQYRSKMFIQARNLRYMGYSLEEAYVLLLGRKPKVV